MNAPLLRQLLRFGVVGAIGFVVDGGLLYLLVARGGDPWAVRLLTFPLAVTVTWALNRRWTFMAPQEAPRGREYSRYLGVQIAGALTNYALYAALLPLTGTSANGALLAFAAGSAAGLVVNFTGARLWVFGAR